MSYLSSCIDWVRSKQEKGKVLTGPDKQENAPEFPGAFYVHLFLRVFPSREPLMDYVASIIHVFLIFNLIGLLQSGQVDQRLSYHLPPLLSRDLMIDLRCSNYNTTRRIKKPLKYPCQ